MWRLLVLGGTVSLLWWAARYTIFDAPRTGAPDSQLELEDRLRVLIGEPRYTWRYATPHLDTVHRFLARYPRCHDVTVSERLNSRSHRSDRA